MINEEYVIKTSSKEPNDSIYSIWDWFKIAHSHAKSEGSGAKLHSRIAYLERPSVVARRQNMAKPSRPCSAREVIGCATKPEYSESASAALHLVRLWPNRQSTRRLKESRELPGPLSDLSDLSAWRQGIIEDEVNGIQDPDEIQELNSAEQLLVLKIDLTPARQTHFEALQRHHPQKHSLLFKSIMETSDTSEVEQRSTSVPFVERTWIPQITKWFAWLHTLIAHMLSSPLCGTLAGVLSTLSTSNLLHVEGLSLTEWQRSRNRTCGSHMLSPAWGNWRPPCPGTELFKTLFWDIDGLYPALLFTQWNRMKLWPQDKTARCSQLSTVWRWTEKSRGHKLETVGMNQLNPVELNWEIQFVQLFSN